MSEWLQITLAIFGGCITILTLWDKIESRVKTEKQPTTDLGARVEKLEKEMEFGIKITFEKYEERFARDLARINGIEDSNKIMLKSLLAIMDHTIDGNHVEQLKAARDDLKDYMLNK